MALLVIVTAALAVLVLGLTAAVLRLHRRLQRLELASKDPTRRLSTVDNLSMGSLDGPGAAASQFVITQVGEPVVEEPVEPAPVVPAPVFADLLLKETVVQTASLVQGLRRALAPETRNRIRFHVRQEVKRSRKQRRTELRAVRREWAARQREAMAAEESAA